MAKKSKILPEDLAAFAQVVQGIKPLTQRKVKLGPTPVKHKRRIVVEEDVPSLYDGSEPRDIVQADDYIAYNQNGVAHKTLRNLHKGQYNVEAILDLHRKTVEEARVLVNQFLQHHHKNGARVVLIVHGKGSLTDAPILKNQINHWLRQASPVIAFCSAAPRHGGNGAVYVLLKSHTEEKFV